MQGYNNPPVWHWDCSDPYLDLPESASRDICLLPKSSGKFKYPFVDSAVNDDVQSK